MDIMAILMAFVLPITILGMIFSHKEKMAKANAKSADSSKQIDALQAELNKVKDRLNTLEAIVTDDKYQLNQEFSKLKSAST